MGFRIFIPMFICMISVVVIAHTETGDEIHIISMREAENHETRKFFSNL